MAKEIVSESITETASLPDHVVAANDLIDIASLANEGLEAAITFLVAIGEMNRDRPEVRELAKLASVQAGELIDRIEDQLRINLKAAVPVASCGATPS